MLEMGEVFKSFVSSLIDMWCPRHSSVALDTYVVDGTFLVDRLAADRDLFVDHIAICFRSCGAYSESTTVREQQMLRSGRCHPRTALLLL